MNIRLFGPERRGRSDNVVRDPLVVRRSSFLRRSPGIGMGRSSSSNHFKVIKNGFSRIVESLRTLEGPSRPWTESLALDPNLG